MQNLLILKIEIPLYKPTYNATVLGHILAVIQLLHTLVHNTI